MTITIVILTFTIVMFVWGRIRSDIVALTGLSVMLIAGILTPEEALAGFSSPIVVMMVGLFVVGGAILQTGLARKIGEQLMRLSNGNENLTLLLIMLVTSVIGAFVSNTGTVALMMPIVVSMASHTGIRISRMLMPLAFAGSLGGMLTLIGTPPNLIIDETLRESGYKGLLFFSFLPVGIISMITGTIVLLPLSKWFLTKKDRQDGKTNVAEREEAVRNTLGKKHKTKQKTPTELAQEYNIAQRIHRFLVTHDSLCKGQNVGALRIQETYGISIIEIRNERMRHLSLLKDVHQSMPLADSILHEDDILYVTGDAEQMKGMAQKMNLKRLGVDTLHFYDLGLTELIVTPESMLKDKKVREAKLRERFKINVLGIRNGENYKTENLADVRLGTGDVLLVQGRWEDIMQLNDDHDNFIVFGSPEQAHSSIIIDHKAPLAAAIMLAMVAAMVVDTIPIAPVTAVIIAALLMVLTGCHRSVDAAYKTIHWESVVLIAAMMPMSVALEKTGISQTLCDMLIQSVGTLGPTALLAGIYLCTSFLTLFISNTATAVLMAPIAMAAAKGIGVMPYAFLFAVTLAASMCFASPFSTPPNALVMKAGNYSFTDYLKVGLPLQVVIGVVMVFLLPLLFPF
ncbi:MAG: SLC13 family permease [Bacteroidaceae bacterium]